MTFVSIYYLLIVWHPKRPGIFYTLNMVQQYPRLVVKNSALIIIYGKLLLAYTVRNYLCLSDYKPIGKLWRTELVGFIFSRTPCRDRWPLIWIWICRRSKSAESVEYRKEYIIRFGKTWNEQCITKTLWRTACDELYDEPESLFWLNYREHDADTSHRHVLEISKFVVVVYIWWGFFVYFSGQGDWTQSFRI